MFSSQKRFVPLLVVLSLVWLFFGCSSGEGSGGGGGGSTPGGPIVTPPNYQPPGALGALVDIGDMVPDNENWYEVRVMCLGENDNVGGQTLVPGISHKGAFLWNGVAMTFLGMHGEGVLGPIHSYNYQEVDDSGVPPTKDPVEWKYSEAVAIGPNGDVACNTTTGTNWPDESEKRAFLWNGVTQIDLAPDESHATPAQRAKYSEAFDVNANFVVYNREWKQTGGEIRARGYAINAFAPYIAGQFFGLSQIVGATRVEPVDVNNKNEVITNSIDTTVMFDDFIYGGSADLGMLTGGQATVGAAINDDPTCAGFPDIECTGHVVGTTGNLAFFWDGGSMLSCGHLGGGTSEAVDINNNNQVIGNSTTASGATHAFLWQLNAAGVGVMTDLGTLGGVNSWVTDINNNGLIVGKSETGATYTDSVGVVYPVVHACAWYNGTIYDLGTHKNFYTYTIANPIPFSEAIAVNDNNRIAGNSFAPNHHYRGFILDSPIP